jgi:hypothetical protein
MHLTLVPLKNNDELHFCGGPTETFIVTINKPMPVTQNPQTKKEELKFAQKILLLSGHLPYIKGLWLKVIKLVNTSLKNATNSG